MKVADIMTTPIIGVAPTASIADAARIMLENSVSGLPVVTSDKHLAGIVTEGDFLQRMELGTQHRRARWLDLFRSTDTLASSYVHEAGRKVSDVMTTNVYAINAEASLPELAELMRARRLKRVPVTARERLVGIVSRSDLMRTMMGALAEPSPVQQSDTALQEKIEAELLRQPWVGASIIRVRVHDGVVDLYGSVPHVSQRDAARVLAENTPGVKGVSNYLAQIEPISGVYIVSEDAGAPVEHK